MSEKKRAIIDISHASSRNGNSFRVTIPKKVVQMMDISMQDNIVMFILEEGRIVLEKLKQL